MCCQKVSEAEALVAGGIGDILVSNQVTDPAKIDRLAALAARARPVGDVRFAYQSAQGIDFGLDYQYDLELPGDFQPANQDGEVQAFYLWPARDVLDQIETGRDYFYDANLAFIAFFLRHGLLTPDHPDHGAIVTGLTGAAV